MTTYIGNKYTSVREGPGVGGHQHRIHSSHLWWGKEAGEGQGLNWVGKVLFLKLGCGDKKFHLIFLSTFSYI